MYDQPAVARRLGSMGSNWVKDIES